MCDESGPCPAATARTDQFTAQVQHRVVAGIQAARQESGAPPLSQWEIDQLTPTVILGLHATIATLLEPQWQYLGLEPGYFGVDE